MMKTYIVAALSCFLLTGCNDKGNTKDPIVILDGNYKLVIQPDNFQFHFENSLEEIIVPPSIGAGLTLKGKPVASISVLKKTTSDKKHFLITNASQDQAEMIVTFSNGTAIFSIIPEFNNYMDVSLHLGGMPVAHGLGDAGAYRESFNLTENKNTTYTIVNDGGRQRWTSTFTIFPQNNFAGVCFEAGQKSIEVSKITYAMSVQSKDTISFHYFLGSPREIYEKYRVVRHEKGFNDVKPKARLFELGWESWDALGWNTNQHTVREILQKFLDHDYRIKWAVTGSGFWEEGGTTTSFGKWNEKFKHPEKFKNWMHSEDISWMIGLRTNLIPNGGPFYPITKNRDKNLKVTAFKGNSLSLEAKNLGYLLSSEKHPIIMTSDIFPIVPSYLVNGEAPGAATWFLANYNKWEVDGIKEDTMMPLDTLTHIFNQPISQVSDNGHLVMARNGNISAPGTLLRINDTNVDQLGHRIPINYFQYAASGYPNVYSDVAGVHNMKNMGKIDTTLRHTWLLSLTSGLAVGAFPEKWPIEKKLIFKKAIDFHYLLGPYLFDAAIKTYKTGYPYTLTPLTIAYPKDSTSSKTNNYEWMIGESILATPLLKNISTGKKDVYLPKGVWFDYESGTKYQGPKKLKNFEISLEKTPIFIGGKGIIIERIEDDLYARIYPAVNTALLNFNFMDGAPSSSIEIDSPNWADLSITNKTTNEKVKFEEINGSYRIIIQKGSEYLVN